MLTRRLFFICLAAFLLHAATVATAWWVTARQEADLNRVIEKNMASVLLLLDLRSEVAGINADYFFINEDEEGRSRYTSFLTAENILTPLMDSLKAASPSKDEDVLVERLAALVTKYRETFREKLRAEKERRKARAEEAEGTASGLVEMEADTDKFNDEIREMTSQISAMAGELLAEHQRSMAQARIEVEELRLTAARTVGVFSLGMLLLFIAGVFSVRSLLKRPARDLCAAMDELSEGTLRNIMAKADGSEVGQIATSFNRLIASMCARDSESSQTISRLHQSMKSTVACFPDPVFVVDDHGEIIMQNPAAQDLLSRLDMSGRTPREVRQKVKAVIESGEPLSPASLDEAHVLPFDDQEHHFLLRITPMPETPGSSKGAVVILQDVTQLRQLDQPGSG